MPEQEGLPAERDLHAGRCDQLSGEEIRDGASEGVPDQEGRIDPGPVLASAPRRHPRVSDQEGDLPRSRRSDGPRVIPRHSFFFLNDTPSAEIYTLSLHDALPI